MFPVNKIPDLNFSFSKFHFSVIKKFFLTLFFCLCFSFLLGCSKNSDVNQNQSVSITDDLNKNFTFDSTPKKIISLAPHITETIYFIGADSLLAGVTDFCDYPPSVSSKKKLGGYVNTNYELIASINPDVILLTAEDVNRPQYKSLNDLGYKIIANNPRTFDDIINMINDYGKLLNKNQSAKNLSDSLINVKNQILSDSIFYNNLNKNLQGNKTLILISSNPVMTANGETFINEIIKLSGLKNIYEEGSIQYPQISQEDVISKNPDVIILAGDTTNYLKMSEKISELNNKFEGTNAIKNKKIIFVDENILFRPSPRILEAVSYIKYKLKQ